VFGLGENTVGQVTGRSRKVIFKEPVLVAQLSNKHIQGIWASRESSLAYDAKGNVYEWGVKENRNELIEVSYVLGEGVVRLEKGYRHFAALSKSGKCTFRWYVVYSWGVMEMQGVPVYSQPKPQVQDCKNIVSFSCGNSHTVAVDGDGNAYGIGSNEMFQLGLPSDRLCKNFKKV
jgi:alpha-tubulin suppressor-like RCC1 family protein